MIGLVYVVVFGFYLALSAGAVATAIDYARKNGKSAKKWGWGTAFVMYSLVFWDWIPTVAVHQYYCAKDSGFWVYKTLDQWKAENPGVMEGLVSYNKNPDGYNVNWPSVHKQSSDGHQKGSVNHLNARFDELVSWEDVSSIFPIVRERYVLMDKKNSEVIARYIDFGSGNFVANREQLKFWMQNSNCIGGKSKLTQFGNFYMQFTGAEK